MTTQGILVAWGWYLVAVLFSAWLLWRGARFLPLTWRTLLTGVPLLVALVPWSVAVDNPSLAPAWLVALFDGVVQEQGSFWRAGWTLPLAVLVGLLPVLLVWRRQRRVSNEQTDSSAS